MSESESTSGSDHETQPPDRRVLALILAVVAAAALVYASFTTWLYNPNNKSQMEIGFGLISNYECGDGTCRKQSNSELVAQWQTELDEIEKRADADTNDPTVQAFAQSAQTELRAPSIFPKLGYITLVSSLLAALSLLVSVAIVLAKKRVVLPIMPTTTAILGIGAGLIAGCVFVATKPGPPGYVGVHVGFLAFGGGVVLGIAAALMLNKLMRPHDPDLLADSMDPDQY
jgi:hypothetical protein